MTKGFGKKQALRDGHDGHGPPQVPVDRRPTRRCGTTIFELTAPARDEAVKKGRRDAGRHDRVSRAGMQRDVPSTADAPRAVALIRIQMLNEEIDHADRSRTSDRGHRPRAATRSRARSSPSTPSPPTWAPRASSRSNWWPCSRRSSASRWTRTRRCRCKPSATPSSSSPRSARSRESSVDDADQ